MRACAPVEMITRAARYSLGRRPTRRTGAGERSTRSTRGDELGAEALGLLAELHHQLGAHDPVGEAGEVLDVGGEHQLAAGLSRATARPR